MCEAVCLLMGGPTLWVNYRGRMRPVEDHPYCGPNLMSLKDYAQPLANQPLDFLEMMDRWCAAGKPTRGDQMIVPDSCRQCGGDGVVGTDGLRMRESGDVERCPRCDGNGLEILNDDRAQDS